MIEIIHCVLYLVLNKTSLYTRLSSVVFTFRRMLL